MASEVEYIGCILPFERHKNVKLLVQLYSSAPTYEAWSRALMLNRQLEPSAKAHPWLRYELLQLNHFVCGGTLRTVSVSYFAEGCRGCNYSHDSTDVRALVAKRSAIGRNGPQPPSQTAPQTMGISPAAASSMQPNLAHPGTHAPAPTDNCICFFPELTAALLPGVGSLTNLSASEIHSSDASLLRHRRRVWRSGFLPEVAQASWATPEQLIRSLQSRLQLLRDRSRGAIQPSEVQWCAFEVLCASSSEPPAFVFQLRQPQPGLFTLRVPGLLAAAMDDVTELNRFVRSPEVNLCKHFFAKEGGCKFVRCKFVHDPAARAQLCQRRAAHSGISQTASALIAAVTSDAQSCSDQARNTSPQLTSSHSGASATMTDVSSESAAPAVSSPAIRFPPLSQILQYQQSAAAAAAARQAAASSSGDTALSRLAGPPWAEVSCASSSMADVPGPAHAAAAAASPAALPLPSGAVRIRSDGSVGAIVHPTSPLDPRVSFVLSGLSVCVECQCGIAPEEGEVADLQLTDEERRMDAEEWLEHMRSDEMQCVVDQQTPMLFMRRQDKEKLELCFTTQEAKNIFAKRWEQLSKTEDAAH